MDCDDTQKTYCDICDKYANEKYKNHSKSEIPSNRFEKTQHLNISKTIPKTTNHSSPEI